MNDKQYEYLGSRQHGAIIGQSDDSAWQRGNSHRAQVLRLLPQRDPGARKGIVCLLGIGDGSTIDLKALLDRFHEVHIVDHRESDIQQAIRAQNLDDRQRLFHHAGDLSGVQTESPSLADPESDDWFERLKDKLQDPAIPEFGEFDCVISNLLIPTVTRQFANLPTGELEQKAELIQLARRRQVELAARQLSPGGRLLLLADVVSSRTLPELSQLPADIKSTLVNALNQGNYFPGAHPGAIEAAIRESGKFQSIQSSLPWIRETPDQHLACIAFAALRAGDEPANPADGSSP